MVTAGDKEPAPPGDRGGRGGAGPAGAPRPSCRPSSGLGVALGQSRSLWASVSLSGPRGPNPGAPLASRWEAGPGQLQHGVDKPHQSDEDLVLASILWRLKKCS